MIQTRIDRQRGCGWRKPGGLYFVSRGPGVECGALPIPMQVCPCCGAGIKPSRGFTWVNLKTLLGDKPCANSATRCRLCPLYSVERAGLLWVGEMYYKTANEFDNEANEFGISRRIAAVPVGFVVGESWLALGHRTAVTSVCKECLDGKIVSRKCSACDGVGFLKEPGIFRLFKPEAIEYVVKGTETEIEIEALEKRGITPVRVERAGQKELIEA